MIDVHSHILPGIDDGAKALEQTVQLALIYAQAGFRRVIATPHYIHGTSLVPSVEAIRKRTKRINQIFREQGIHLTLFPGMEVALDPNLPALLDQKKVQALAGKCYLLLETPFQRLPLGWDSVVSDIRSRGYRVLMAHPERCSQLAQKPKLIDELMESGVFLQVNWGSFLGHGGAEAKKVAHHLAQKGLIHCLATDSHDPDHRHPGHIKAAAAVLLDLVGLENIKLLAGANPLRVLRGDPLEPMTPVETVEPSVERKRWWGFFGKAND